MAPCTADFDDLYSCRFPLVRGGEAVGLISGSYRRLTSSDGGDEYGSYGSYGTTDDTSPWKLVKGSHVTVTNTDDDTAGLQVHQSGTMTDEAGNMTASLSVVLTAQPLRPVEVSVKTSDKSESSLDVEMLMFDGGNWNEEQVVEVRGVDDFVHDMDVNYSVTIASVAGSDAKFVGLSEELEFTNVDDDEVGLQLLLNSNATTSLGEQTKPRLDSEPAAPVFHCGIDGRVGGRGGHALVCAVSGELGCW